VHDDSQKRETARVSRFLQLSGSAIDTLPDKIDVQFCVIYRVGGSTVPVRIQIQGQLCSSEHTYSRCNALNSSSFVPAENTTHKTLRMLSL
jgi:hypothetical protein